jgi:hypothetical protein
MSLRKFSPLIPRPSKAGGSGATPRRHREDAEDGAIQFSAKLADRHAGAEGQSSGAPGRVQRKARAIPECACNDSRLAEKLEILMALAKSQPFENKEVKYFTSKLNTGRKNAPKMKVYPGMLMKTKDRFLAMRLPPSMFNKNKPVTPTCPECY